jgi:hypothetical protein
MLGAGRHRCGRAHAYQLTVGLAGADVQVIVIFIVV